MSEFPETPIVSTPELLQNQDSNGPVLEKIKRTDIMPRLLGVGETEIIFQRHGEYVRDEDDPHSGSLTPAARDTEFAQAKTFLEKQFETIPQEERSRVRLLVLASDTTYGQNHGMRSTETANEVMRAARKTRDDLGLSDGFIMNDSSSIKGDSGARPTELLREPAMFEQSPEFVEFLVEKYGAVSGPSDFWKAFEGDWEEEARVSMGAEGPAELADRLQKSLDMLARYSKFFHHKNPDSRLIVWATTHYDTISPFVKSTIIGRDKDQFLGVDYGAGIVIGLNPDGNMKTEIAGEAYTVPTQKS